MSEKDEEIREEVRKLLTLGGRGGGKVAQTWQDATAESEWSLDKVRRLLNNEFYIVQGSLIYKAIQWMEGQLTFARENIAAQAQELNKLREEKAALQREEAADYWRPQYEALLLQHTTVCKTLAATEEEANRQADLLAELSAQVENRERQWHPLVDRFGTTHLVDPDAITRVDRSVEEGRPLMLKVRFSDGDYLDVQGTEAERFWSLLEGLVRR